MARPTSSSLALLGEIRLALAAVICLIAVGTAGYVIIEGWSPWEAFYMTITVLSTEGFQVHPLSPGGQVLTAALIVFGVGIALWAATNLVQVALSPEARRHLRRRRMRHEISKMTGHFIVCGYGRIGREVCACLSRRHLSHVVGDSDPANVADLEETGTPFIQGDAADDEVLRALGIDRAKGLIAAAGSDADNTFIVLSARALRPDILIVARATTPEAERKLLAAGANRVLSPYLIGARRIAAAATQPNVVEFLDVAMQGDEMSLAMEEVMVAEDSPVAGQTLADSGIRQHSGAVVVAIKDTHGNLNSNPAPNTIIHPGDILIAVGAVRELDSLVALCGRVVV